MASIEVASRAGPAATVRWRGRGGPDRGPAPGSHRPPRRVGRGGLRGDPDATRAGRAGLLPPRAGRLRRGRGRLPGDVPRPVPPGRIDPGRGVPRPLAAARGPPGGPEGAAGRGPPAGAGTPRRATGARGRRGDVIRPPPAGARRGRSLAREVPRAGPPVLLRGPDARRRGGGPRLAGRDGPRAAVAGPGHAPHAVDATGRRHHARGPGRGDGRGG